MTDLDMTDVQWHLAGMNEAWLDYHQIEVGEKKFATPLARAKALQHASDQFHRECQWLEAHGYPWNSLPYDKQEHRYLLPESVESGMIH